MSTLPATIVVRGENIHYVSIFFLKGALLLKILYTAYNAGSVFFCQQNILDVVLKMFFNFCLIFTIFCTVINQPINGLETTNDEDLLNHIRSDDLVVLFCKYFLNVKIYFEIDFCKQDFITFTP